jgi:gas vesicle protein
MSAKRNLLIGVGVGAVLGILFAPHKGSKTRKMIAQRGSELREGWNNLKDTVNNTISNIRDTSEDINDEAADTSVYISSSMQEEWKG